MVMCLSQKKEGNDDGSEGKGRGHAQKRQQRLCRPTSTLFDARHGGSASVRTLQGDLHLKVFGIGEVRRI
jgi:hypothetical protein